MTLTGPKPPPRSRQHDFDRPEDSGKASRCWFGHEATLNAKDSGKASQGANLSEEVFKIARVNAAVGNKKTTYILVSFTSLCSSRMIMSRRNATTDHHHRFVWREFNVCLLG